MLLSSLQLNTLKVSNRLQPFGVAQVIGGLGWDVRGLGYESDQEQCYGFRLVFVHLKIPITRVLVHFWPSILSSRFGLVHVCAM